MDIDTTNQAIDEIVAKAHTLPQISIEVPEPLKALLDRDNLILTAAQALSIIVTLDVELARLKAEADAA